jgi:hypothetical protein
MTFGPKPRQPSHSQGVYSNLDSFRVKGVQFEPLTTRIDLEPTLDSAAFQPLRLE